MTSSRNLCMVMACAPMMVAIALGAGSASAAPSGMTATETIEQLRANGNDVVINRVGTGSLDRCSVTSVQSIERPMLAMGSPLTGIPVPQRKTTVHVGLAC